MDIFNHMIKLRNNNDKLEIKPNSHLNFEMMEFQEGIFNSSANGMEIGTLLNDVGGKGAQKKITERRLTSNGEVESLVALANFDDRLRRLDDANIFTASIYDIRRTEQANKTRKNDKNKDQHKVNIPKYLNK